MIEILNEMANQNSNPNVQQFNQSDVDRHILTVRGVQVILDKDLAYFYQVETKRLNEQARRNISRFPIEFMFQLSNEEWASIRSQIATLNGRGRHSKYLPYAYTEYGVIMAAAILKSGIADKASVSIVKAFVAMRRFLVANSEVFRRLDRVEYRLSESDHKFEEIYSKLEEKSLKPEQGIFFDGQIYDAYSFICSLIKSAVFRIVLVDNYVDYTVLTMMDMRSTGVTAEIYTQNVRDQLMLDIAKHNAQYPPVSVFKFNKSHDRFLIIDNKVHHVGASIKDLGKKWFAVSLMEAQDADEIIDRLRADAISVSY